MKNVVLGAALASALVAAAGSASAQQVYGDVARVISSTPVYERVSMPRRECQTEQVTANEPRRDEPGIGAGTVLGALIGGVIGHQFGNSTGGRDHGTAAGAVIGGLIGNQADREGGYAPVARDVERCRDVPGEARERIVGYDVRYEYNGREFRARMGVEPGPTIPVNVEVRPPAASVIGGPRPPSYRGTY